MQERARQHNQRQRGLTRVEAVVIIAITGFAFAAIRPVFLHARTYGSAAVCMANLQGLMRAWLLYAKDHDDQVVGARPHDHNAHTMESYPAYPAGPYRKVWNFVGSPHDENGRERNNILEDEWRGIRRGGLWSYLEDERLFHCPLDRRYTQPPSGFAGTYLNSQKGGYRTYSLGAVWNCGPSGWSTGEERVVVYKTSEIMEPELKLVFLEETDGCGYNHNTWNMFLNTRSHWGDAFGVLHGRQSMFGFADGHAGPHRWQDQSTFEMAESGRKQYPLKPGERADIDWFRWRYVPGNMPEEYKNL
ncbi:MAG: hypothetical protein IH624_17775 [Phycisphaerae bacterium]|nr:hypothetical protein [Phycisphaerae bacterium]